MIAFAAVLAAVFALGTATPWVGLAAVVTWGLCAAVGHVVLTNSPIRGDARAAVDVAVGLCVLAMFATVSAWVAGGTSWGAWLFAAAGFACLPAWRRKGARLSPTGQTVLMASVVLGCAHQLGQGVEWHGVHLITDRYGDYRYHQHQANLIRSHGLPLVDLYGWLATPIAPLGHRGLPTLLAALRDLWVVGADDAARGLGVFGYGLLGLTGAAFASAIPGVSASRASLFSWIGALTALTWSPLLAWANAVITPKGPGSWALLKTALTEPTPHSHWAPVSLAAGAYHNLPQLISVALGFASLVALSRWPKKRAGGVVLVASCLMAVSGLVKPTMMVLLAPALVIVLAQRRAGWRSWMAALTPLVIGVVLYELDRFTHANTTLQIVIVDTSRWSVRNWPFLFGLAVGIVWLPMLAMTRGLSDAAFGRHRWGVFELVLIAAAGSVLFATLFAEADRSRAHHGNLLWGLAGVLPACAPIAIAKAMHWRRSARFLVRSAAHVALFAAFLHIVPGTLYAASYPDNETVRRRGAAHTRLKIEAASSIPRDVPALSDPWLDLADHVPAIDRIIITRMAFSPDPIARWQTWRAAIRAINNDKPLTEEQDALLNAYQAVVVGAPSSKLRKFLLDRGYRPIPGGSNRVAVALMQPRPHDGNPGRTSPR